MWHKFSTFVSGKLRLEAGVGFRSAAGGGGAHLRCMMRVRYDMNMMDIV